MITSIDAEKTFDKFQHPSMKKKKKKDLQARRRQNLPQPTKGHQWKEKLASNIILETFSLKSGIRQGYLLYTSITI